MCSEENNRFGICIDLYSAYIIGTIYLHFYELSGSKLLNQFDMGGDIDIWPKLFTIFECLILLPVSPLSEYASVWKADMMYIAVVWILYIIIVTKGYGMFNYNIFVSCSVTLDLCLTGIFKTGDL